MRYAQVTALLNERLSLVRVERLGAKRTTGRIARIDLPNGYFIEVYRDGSAEFRSSVLKLKMEKRDTHS